MKLKVKRVTLRYGVVTPITFDTECGKWLVKNLSLLDILVSFDPNFDEDEAIKIQKGMGQVVVANEQYDWTNVYKSNTIYVKGSGEVEVQQLCYK